MIFPPGPASGTADSFDLLFLVMVIFSGFIVLLVATLIVVFSIRFRSGSGVARHHVKRLVSREVEIAWTAVLSW